MKKLVFLFTIISGLLASPWVSRKNLISEDNFELFCHNGQAYYAYEIGTRAGTMFPAIFDGEFVRCKIISVDHHIISADNNKIEFFIIKNNKKIIVNP